MDGHDEPEDFERSAGGMDYDDPIRERASKFGTTLASDGPGAIFDQVEALLPESWREQIAAYPLTAVILGVGLGFFLGMKKGDELLAAGSAAIGAAASANIAKVLGQQ